MNHKTKLTIEPFMHNCIVKDGIYEGNKVIIPVYPNQFEAEDTCDFCGELKATDHDILVYLYKTLIPDSSIITKDDKTFEKHTC